MGLHKGQKLNLSPVQRKKRREQARALIASGRLGGRVHGLKGGRPRNDGTPPRPRTPPGPRLVRPPAESPVGPERITVNWGHRVIENVEPSKDGDWCAAVATAKYQGSTRGHRLGLNRRPPGVAVPSYYTSKRQQF